MEPGVTLRALGQLAVTVAVRGTYSNWFLPCKIEIDTKRWSVYAVADMALEQRIIEIIAAPEARERHAWLVDDLTSELERARAEVAAALRVLEDLGAGKCHFDRAGKPDCFEVHPLGLRRLLESRSELPTEVTTDSGTWHHHRYKVRPDVVAELKLPVDLTPGEASALAAFIQRCAVTE